MVKYKCAKTSYQNDIKLTIFYWWSKAPCKNPFFTLVYYFLFSMRFITPLNFSFNGDKTFTLLPKVIYAKTLKIFFKLHYIYESLILVAKCRLGFKNKKAGPQFTPRYHVFLLFSQEIGFLNLFKKNL